MTGREYWLVDAGARAKLLGEVEPSDLDWSPWEIDIHVTVNGYSASSGWKGPLLISSSLVWLHGPKGTETLSDRRTFRAQDLGFEYGAPTEDNAKEGNGLYSKEHGNEAHELHRSGDALFSAWRGEEDPKLRELMQAKEWKSSIPTPPDGSRMESSPDSVLFPTESPPRPGLLPPGEARNSHCTAGGATHARPLPGPRSAPQPAPSHGGRGDR